jgi:phosphonate transport system substrate-binding protein
LLKLLKLLVFSLICTPLLASQPKKIRIGFIPAGPAKEFVGKATEFAELVQNELEVPVEIYIPKNYQSLVKAMKEKRVDFAFFTAMTYVFAEKEANAKVLLRKVWEERDYYFSALVVPKDSPIKSLSDLKGKKIAYVDDKSTSGYLYPSVALKNAGLDPLKSFSKVTYSGNHKKAVEDLEAGKADVAAVFAMDAKAKEGAWTHLFDKNKNMRPIWVSKHIPSDPFCVRNDFYEKHPQLTHNMMFFLKRLSTAEKKDHKLKSLLDIDKVDMATSKQYESVREMVQKLNLKL